MLLNAGETEKLVELLLEGYDHILDVTDGGVNIVDIAAERGRDATVQFLQSIPNYVVRFRNCLIIEYGNYVEYRR